MSIQLHGVWYQTGWNCGGYVQVQANIGNSYCCPIGYYTQAKLGAIQAYPLA